MTQGTCARGAVLAGLPILVAILSFAAAATLGLEHEATGGEVPPPRLRILSPANNSTGYGSTVVLTLHVENFTLRDPSEPSTGGSVGHVVYFLDDVLVGADHRTEFAYTALSAGAHWFRAKLAHSDGRPVSPDAEDAVRVVVAPGMPTVRIVSPVRASVPAEHNSSTLVVKVEVDDFQLRPHETAHGAPQRVGHLHYSIRPHGLMEPILPPGYDTHQATLAMMGLAPGLYVVQAELRDNHHRPLSPPVFDEVRIRIPPGRPGLHLLEPSEEDQPGAREVLNMSVRVENFTLSESGRAGHGRLRFCHAPIGNSTCREDAVGNRTVHSFRALPQGAALVRAELVNLTGAPLQPPVYVERWVQLPAVRFRSPLEGAQPVATHVTAAVDVEGLRLVPPGVAAPGEGRIRYSINGDVRGTTNETVWSFTSLAPGNYTLAAEAVLADGRSFPAPVVATVHVRLRSSPTTGSPSIRFTAPAAGATVGPNVTVAVDVLNFELVDPSSPAVGDSAGHIQYSFAGNDSISGRTAAKTFTFWNLPEGVHALRAELVGPDHRPLAPAVFDERTVVVEAARSNSPARLQPWSEMAVLLALAGAAWMAANRR
ncbi:MAG TPA: hypothetical protein VM681_04890 [Candidatus Thermoplasmatota archaeon]|nr:hypothetical protein [Candidatus Thermoplasmatota archaeon]